MIDKARRTVSVARAAEICGVSKMTVHRLIDRGDLEAYKVTSAINSRYVIYADSIELFVRKIQGRVVKI